MKRFMFCLICRIHPKDFKLVWCFFLGKVRTSVSTNNDAYAFCKKHHIKGNYHSSEFHNIVTENEKVWLTEAFFLTESFGSESTIDTSRRLTQALHDNYHGFVYNQHPPLYKIASISWMEILSCCFYWLRLKRADRAIFDF
jgi:hypothetical protein